MIASRCRSHLAPDCTTSERLAKERLRCHGLDPSVGWARRQRCSLRCGGLGGARSRADRPAAALVPSTSHGAARIMIELRNKHTLTGKLCCFQIVLCAQLGGDFLSQSLTSKGLCRRIHFRRMPSVNDGPSDMPDSGFAATSLLAGSPTSRITCSAARVLLVQPPRARPRPSPQLRVLPVRKPPSSRPWQLLALPPWPLRARPCGRLHAPPSPPPRVARVRQPRSSLSQRLRALPASPPRARLFAPRRASPAAQLRAGLSPRRQALLARPRLRDPWPLAWPF